MSANSRPASVTERVYLYPHEHGFALVARGKDGAGSQTIVAVEDVAGAIAVLPGSLADEASSQFAALARAQTSIARQDGAISLDPAIVMGILNVTPDSFSDGGVHQNLTAAAAHATAMRAAGAGIVDIGGESTRPGSARVSINEELRRVVPIVERVASDGGVVSIDTRQSEVMMAALAAGAAIVNDVSALRHDPRSLAVVAKAEVPVILMHAPGEGDNLHAGACYADVAFDVFDFLKDRRDVAIAAGIAAGRIILDPGIGFGKSLAENLRLVRMLPLFRALGCPVLVGASRKRMIAAIAGDAPPDRRLGGSLALALAALDGGAQVLRVHDVDETVQAAAVWRALRDTT